MNRMLVWISATVIRILGLSLRLSIEDQSGIIGVAERAPVIVAFWHNRTALMAFFQQRYCGGRVAATFISRSRDGQFMTEVASHFGIMAVRGSSSRHGTAAALTAIRAAGEGSIDIAITPDGPRGPCYQVQPGLLRLAQITGYPIVPVTYHLGWKYELSSWDRFQIPFPFSSCRLIMGAPIEVPQDATDGDWEKLRTRVTEALGTD